MKTTIRHNDISEFLAEIKLLVDKLDELENEKSKIHSTDGRFWDILREKNNIRIKLKSIQTRLEYLGQLDKYAKEIFKTIPRF